MNKVSAVINGQEYSNFLSYEFSRDIEGLLKPFSLTLNIPEDRRVIKTGNRVVIKIDGESFLTGFIEDVLETDQQDKSKLLPQLTKKEWSAVLTAVFIVLSVGFSLGFVTNVKRVNDLSNIVSIVDPLITIEKDLNDKLKIAAKQLDKIDDDDLYGELGSLGIDKPRD